MPPDPLGAPAITPAPAVSRLPRGLSALRHRNFRVFWTGQLVSLVGTWMATVARSWLVLEMTNDPFALGIVAAAQFTPVLLLGLIGGVVADVAPKRRALIVLQTIMCLNAALLAALVLTDRIELWMVIALTGVLGTANAIEMPTRQAFVIEMVGREDIGNAVALNSAAFNTSRIVGPAAAGLLIAFVSLPAALVIDAVSYLGAIYALLRIDPSGLQSMPRRPFSRAPSAIAGQLAEGLRYVRDTPQVLLPIIVLGLVSTAGMNFQVLIPVMARDVLGAGPDGYGFLLAASALGSLSAALAIAFGMRPTPRLLLGGALAFGVLESLFALSRVFPVSLALMFGMGFGVIAIAATANTTIQLTAPDRLRGRVMSVYVTVFAGSTPIGGLIAGTIASRAGAPTALLFGGVVSALVAVAAVVGWRPSLRAPAERIADRRV